LKHKARSSWGKMILPKAKSKPKPKPDLNERRWGFVMGQDYDYPLLAPLMSSCEMVEGPSAEEAPAAVARIAVAVLDAVLDARYEECCQ
jgi:hypothetical protein